MEEFKCTLLGTLGSRDFSSSPLKSRVLVSHEMMKKHVNINKYGFNLDIKVMNTTQSEFMWRISGVGYPVWGETGAEFQRVVSCCVCLLWFLQDRWDSCSSVEELGTFWASETQWLGGDNLSVWWVGGGAEINNTVYFYISSIIPLALILIRNYQFV